MLRSLLYSRHVASGITYNFNRQREPAFRQARVMLAVHGGSVDDRIGGLVISKTSVKCLFSRQYLLFIMAVLRSRCGHYISSCGFFFLFLSFFFFHRLISVVADWIWPYSANLECMSEMCCTLLAENTGRKKSPKIAMAPSHNFVRLYLRN